VNVQTLTEFGFASVNSIIAEITNFVKKPWSPYIPQVQLTIIPPTSAYKTHFNITFAHPGLRSVLFRPSFATNILKPKLSVPWSRGAPRWRNAAEGRGPGTGFLFLWWGLGEDLYVIGERKDIQLKNISNI
jgi:hypothetical protein